MEKTDEDPNLPSKIIWVEILPRLPRKKLMQFRCVSKSWKALLSANPGFWRIHRNFHPHNTGYLLFKAHSGSAFGSGSDVTRKHYLLLVKAGQDRNTPSYVTDLMPLPFQIIKTPYANSLVLGRSGWINDPIYIYNPFAQDSVIVPNPTFEYEQLSIGFSPRTNEYKVVATLRVPGYVATLRVEGLVGFKIFTLGQCSWRDMVVDWYDLSFVHPPSSDFWNSTVCVHGVLHWLAPSDEVIFALDIGDERFRIIPVPSHIRSSKKIIEVDGCLCIVCETGKVWILKDYIHQVWVAETIEFPRRIFRLPQCASDTGELVFGVSKDNYLQLYDRKSKSSRQSEIIFPKMFSDLGLRLDYSDDRCDDCIVPLQ
ncbi:PREDICTED: F-box protein At3g07870-like [Fragaria vesca subsp. vesca]|uniref:F-box protein At3g07870-like n=1 Tax=Fragaria vesca subsp. vesca TaxID=101020 RepID=UPI0002C3780C|nr:PREDICTED: F-box protein At3g07870-like [Fragaria vesca subsp. vesca]